jgi:pimeloyl-ACP methyl ester carboxylesterase
VFGGNASCGLDYAAEFTDAALASDLFVLCDFPGYGHCAGHPSPQSIRRSTQAVVPAVAAKLGVSVEQLRPHLRGFGHSLGCAAVLMAMHDHHISSGVLVAPFTRMVDMAKRMLGWPLCEVLHHRFDNIAELRAIEAQDGTHLSLIHGTEDEVIPVSMSRALQKTFPSLITLHEAQGADHNSILDTHNDDIVAMMLKL